MSGFDRSVIWFNRLVLASATLVMATIAIRNLRDPVAAAQSLDIVLRSASAVTVARVGFGGFPLGFAAALITCLVDTRRLLIGTVLVLAVVGGATVARVQGLLIDGATPYNLGLLRPELAMVALSSVGAFLERRRRGAYRALRSRKQ